MGSSLGNFTRTEASTFFKGFAKVLVNENDALLIGLDACKDREGYTMAITTARARRTNSIWMAWHKQIYLLATRNLKKACGTLLANMMIVGRHQAFYVSAKDVMID